MTEAEKIFKDIEASGRGAELEKIARSREAQNLSGVFNAGELEMAARSGDTEMLRRIITRLMETGDGRRLAENVRKMMEK